MTSSCTFFEAQKRASLFITEHGGDASVADYLLTGLMGWREADLLLHYRDLITPEQLVDYKAAVHRYVNGEPAQYIVGTTNFYGLPLKVNRSVLIPRPETEELVDWILATHGTAPIQVLDVGTGSGAIALALKHERPNWQVVGSDISESALKVACENANVRDLAVNFVKSDLFQSFEAEKFDLIVSNPPYIAQNELKYMDESVIQFEPHLALFANDNGLAIYQGIADHFRTVAKPHGEIFLEIGFHQEAAVVAIFKRALPDANVETKHDFNGNQRMVRIKY